MKTTAWGWIWGILTTLGVVIAIIFFVATQSITGRDFITVAIGAAVGGGVAGIIAVVIFHRHDRNADRNADREAQRAEQELARRESDARISREDREAAAASAREDRELEARLAREQQLLDKKLETVEALPTRSERLASLREEETNALIDIRTAKGTAQAAAINAANYAEMGMPADAEDQRAASDTWVLRRQHLEAQLQTIRDELAQVMSLTDEEFLIQQKHLRGLD